MRAAPLDASNSCAKRYGERGIAIGPPLTTVSLALKSMSLLRILAVLLLVTTLTGFIGAGSNSDVVVAPGQRNVFPSVSGINLVGEPVALPRGFEGHLNLVVLGFEMEQQKDVDTWIAALDGIRSSLPGLEFYEVPVINAGSAAFRFWVNNGMHFGILDLEARKRTITIYVDRSKFNSIVGVGDIDRIYALLVDNTGRILWRGEGPASAQSIAELIAAASRAVEARGPRAAR